MQPTLVLQPSTAFEQIAGTLLRLGWARSADTSIAPPLVPGEPEFASWRRGDDEEARVSYTFNPVVRLRVLVFYGARAGALCADAERALPALGLAELRELLQSSDVRRLLLGLFAARELGAFMALDLIEPLLAHAEETVARAARKTHEELLALLVETGAARLREEKQRHPERSALFPRLGDRRVRRQTLRWLIRDRQETNADVDAVLRSGLFDEDWEVRATAMLAAMRLRARSLGKDVRCMQLPRTSREGPDETDRTILFAARKIVLSGLAGESAPEMLASGGDARAGLRRQLWRCVTGQPIETYDRIFLFINALTEPLEIEDEPPPAHDCVVEERELYMLRRARVEMCWVANLPHWLGCDDQDLALINPIRRTTPPAGFFITRRPLSVADARRIDPGGTAGENNSSHDAGVPAGEQPYLCGRAEALRLCELLGQLEGIAVSLPNADEWEMAMRGTDGRRYPWGNGYEGDPQNLSSPWGLEQLAGSRPEWTRARAPDGGQILCGGFEDWRCAARKSVSPDDASALAAVRPIIAC